MLDQEPTRQQTSTGVDELVATGHGRGVSAPSLDGRRGHGLTTRVGARADAVTELQRVQDVSGDGGGGRFAKPGTGLGAQHRLAAGRLAQIGPAGAVDEHAGLNPEVGPVGRDGVDGHDALAGAVDPGRHERGAEEDPTATGLLQHGGDDRRERARLEPHASVRRPRQRLLVGRVSRDCVGVVLQPVVDLPGDRAARARLPTAHVGLRARPPQPFLTLDDDDVGPRTCCRDRSPDPAAAAAHHAHVGAQVEGVRRGARLGAGVSRQVDARDVGDHADPVLLCA